MPTRPLVEDILTIDPPPLSFITGITARVPKNGLLALTAITWSQSLELVSSTLVRWNMAALLTSTSNLPNLAVTISTTTVQSVTLVTSSQTKIDLPSAWDISAVIVWPSCYKTSAMATVAPSLVKRRASAKPIPRLAPVIRATLSCNLMSYLMIIILCWCDSTGVFTLSLTFHQMINVRDSDPMGIPC